jgi:4a-hydroxytetrahydrobiopterin dehydratase
MSTQPSPAFSSNYDPEKGITDLEPLLKSNGGKWLLLEGGKGVERSFKFKTFKKTWVCLPQSLFPSASHSHHSKH